MAILIFIIALIALLVCLGEGNSKKGFAWAVLAILYFPIGVILALTKKYK